MSVEVRLTHLVTRDQLMWSSWTVREVANAIQDRCAVPLSDGGYVNPALIITFYSSEVWAAKEAAAEERREKARVEWKTAREVAKKKKKRWWAP